MNHTLVISLTLVLCGGTVFAETNIQEQSTLRSHRSPELNAPKTFPLEDGYRGFADRLGAIDLGGELFDFEASSQHVMAPSNDMEQFSARDNRGVAGSETQPFHGELAELGLADTLCAEQDQYEQDSNRGSVANLETKLVSSEGRHDVGAADREGSQTAGSQASSVRGSRLGANHRVAEQGSGSTEQRSAGLAWLWGIGLGAIPLMALAARGNSSCDATHRVRTSSDASTFIERKTPAMRMMSNFDTPQDAEGATWYPNEAKIGRPVACRDSRWPQDRSRLSQTATAKAKASHNYTPELADDLETQLLEDTNAMTLETNQRLGSSGAVSQDQPGNSKTKSKRAGAGIRSSSEYGFGNGADDLTEINGISRTSEQVLNEIGIERFSHLADANPEEIRAAFEARGNFRHVKPRQWQNEAREILQGVVS